MALACVALLTGCGGLSSIQFGVPRVGQPLQVNPLIRTGSVRVYFCTKTVCAKNATRSEERRVSTAVFRELCVSRVVFVSKAKALARLNKRLGTKKALPPGLGNPLPDSLRVTPASQRCAAKIVATARAAHWPGVQQVTLARPKS